MSVSLKTVVTAGEFQEIAPRLGPCELVRGEVVRLSPGGFRHSRVAMRIGWLLETWAQQSGLGRVIGVEAGFLVEQAPDTVRGADVAYISWQRLPKGREPTGFCDTPPELVVEVRGEGQSWRELLAKAGEYLTMGVNRVWVVDPEKRRVHILRPDESPSVLYERDTVADSEILPGFTCSAGEFFAD